MNSKDHYPAEVDKPENENNTQTSDEIHGERWDDNEKMNIKEYTSEENGYGPDMVGKPLPGYALNRSVTYSHYYFVKMKPVDGITYARCNLCWFDIGQPTDYKYDLNSKVFLKVSGFKFKTQPTSSSTSNLIKHLRGRHPDIMEQFIRQHVEQSKVQNELKETERNLKLKRKEEIMIRKEIKTNRIKRKYDKKESKVKQDPPLKLSEEPSDYDFEHIDEDIKSITVGEPKVDFNPREAVVFSHNYFRRLYPHMTEKVVKSSNSTSTPYAMCIPCAKINEKFILKTPGGTTTNLNNHIGRKHPDLLQKFKEQGNVKSLAVHQRPDLWAHWPKV